MNLLPYLHPVAAGLATLLLFYVGSLGLRARNDRRRARQLLAQHARLAMPVFYLIVISWVGGLMSTWKLRDEFELGSSTHIRIGVVLVLALLGSVISARRIAETSWREGHPWFGISALLLAAAQIFFGLQITP